MVFLHTIIVILVALFSTKVILNSKEISLRLLDIYVKNAEKTQKGGGLLSNIYVYNPKYWKTKFIRFIFRTMVIFFAILMPFIAYAVLFGPVSI